MRIIFRPKGGSMSYVTSAKCIIRLSLSIIITLLFWPSIVLAQPVAVAVADPVEAQSGETVNLDGSGSTGANYYEWFQESGPSVDILDRYTAQASFIAPNVEGETELVFYLTVMNEMEQTGNDTVSIWVYPSQNGSELEADAGEDQYANEGEPVTLDGRGSTGTEPLSYAWTQTGGPDIGLFLYEDTDQPEFTAPDTGEEALLLTFQLTLTDSQQDTDSDSVDVYVFPDDVEISTTPDGDPLGIRVDNDTILNDFLVTTTNAYSASTTADGTAPVKLPHGLAEFSLQSQTPITGTSIFTSTVSFFLPTAASPDHGWAKLSLQGNGAWIDFSDHVVFNPSRTVVSMTLTDNEDGDDNPAIGIIDDPSGLALFADDDDDDDDDDDGDDCFIMTCMPR